MFFVVIVLVVFLVLHFCVHDCFDLKSPLKIVQYFKGLIMKFMGSLFIDPFSPFSTPQATCKIFCEQIILGSWVAAHMPAFSGANYLNQVTCINQLCQDAGQVTKPPQLWEDNRDKLIPELSSDYPSIPVQALPWKQRGWEKPGARWSTRSAWRNTTMNVGRFSNHKLSLTWSVSNFFPLG